MPSTSGKILEQIGGRKLSLDELESFENYVSGTKVSEKPEILFARLDEKEVLEKAEEIQKKQLAMIEATNKEEGAEESTMEPLKPEITIDDFAKLDFRIGEIVKCEAVEKSKKLLRSQVKIGNETKQILSGIRKQYTPEEMVGKKVVVLANLKPAKLAGELSEGMLICAEDEDGTLALLRPEKDMKSGSQIS